MPDAAKPTPPENVLLTQETYVLPQDEAAKVLTIGSSGEARHDAVLTLMKQGKARMDNIMALVSKSGQRSVVECVDEFRYATEFDSSLSPPIGTAFETRNTGDTIEWEPTLSADRKFCAVSIVPQTVRFLGMAKTMGASQKWSFFDQPRFQTAKLTTSIDTPIGRNEFIGTESDPPQFTTGDQKSAGTDVRLVFERVDLAVTGDSSAAEHVATLPDPASGTPAPATPLSATCVELQLSFFSLDREAARQILNKDVQGQSCYDAVQALAAKNEAKLERLLVTRTKNGQRAVTEEVQEFRYPTEFDPPPSTGTTGVADPTDMHDVRPSAFETRNIGLTMEVEPTLSPDGKIIDLNLVPQLVSYEGDGGGTKDQPAPTFETRKITTSLTVLAGQPALLGTFSHPGDSGFNFGNDASKVWFGFVTATPF